MIILVPSLDESTADRFFVQDAQRKLSEERNLITIEIAKLGCVTR